MKCDIEIHITENDDPYDKIQIPQCLRDSESESNSNVKQEKDIVYLPDRYACRLKKTIENSSSANGNLTFGNDLISRENDLTTALKWIRQEILQMKAQDRALMKQFIDLRSTIVQLRCMYEFPSSNSDISSLSGSNYSLDDSFRSSPSLKHGYLEVDGTEFRARTSSLLTPRKTQITQLKWRNRFSDKMVIRTSPDLKLQMKEQDRALMKQFIDLRSTIVQLRCMYEFPSSNSDISSLSGSNYSLDDSFRSSPSLKHGYLEVDGTEFRARTSSLLTPRKTHITQLKWRSNEYI